MSKRPYVAVIVSACSSAGNFLVSVAMAHTLPIAGFGQFAVALSVYVLAIGTIRSAVTDPLLGTKPSESHFRHALRRTSFLGLAVSIIVVIAGVVLGIDYLVVIGLSIHGCSVFEYSRVMNMAAFNANRALIQQVAWMAVSILDAALILLGYLPPLAGFAVWAGSCAVIGYVQAFLLKLRCQPLWDQQTVRTRVSIAFGLDFLVGSGSGQIAINAASATAGLSVVGALRAGGTLLGPITLIVNAARSLLIPLVSRLSAESRSGAMVKSWVTSLTMGALALPFLIFATFLPDPIGELVLGGNWLYAKPLLPFLTVELLFIVLTTVPFAGHRALLAARNTIVIRIGLAIARILSIVLTATLVGAVGAAMAMAAMAILGFLVWWWSYSSLLKKERGTG